MSAEKGAYGDSEEIGKFLLDLVYGSGMLPGCTSVFTVKLLLKGYEVLLVLQRKDSTGFVEVAYFGSETVGGCVRKARNQAREGKIAWKTDRWANERSVGQS